MTIWKSNFSDKIKQEFFQAATMSILLYSCLTGTLMKHLEKKIKENYTRILCAVLNKSWKQHSTKQQLYSHLPPITQVRQTRHVEHCWRRRDGLISNILIWTPTHTYQCWLTSKNLHSSALWGHWVLSRGLAKSNDL